MDNIVKGFIGFICVLLIIIISSVIYGANKVAVEGTCKNLNYDTGITTNPEKGVDSSDGGFTQPDFAKCKTLKLKFLDSTNVKNVEISDKTDEDTTKLIDGKVYDPNAEIDISGFNEVWFNITPINKDKEANLIMNFKGNE